MLVCRDVTVTFGATHALDGAGIELETGRVGAIIGPSGSGKSTLLRVIAGLEIPDAGTVTWDGEDLAGVPAHARGFGLMFQDYALFPHLDVAGNVAFALEVAGVPPVERRRRVEELLELVGLPGFGSRPIAELSGGEQQRVALARTLAPSPRLVMLDEPLGALDRALRDTLLPEMRTIFRRLGTTVLYVTHDHDEAFAVADVVFVMRRGAIVGAGHPDELWRHPPDLETARFFGFGPALAVEVAEDGADLGFATVPTSLPPGTYTAVLTPGALEPDPTGPVKATVVDARYTTAGYALDVITDGHAATVRSSTWVEPGDTIALAIDPEAVLFYAG